MFNWEKKGLIYKPDAKSDWPSHAVLPFLDLAGDKYFMFYGSRTKENIAYSFKAEFDHKTFTIRPSKTPILEPGEIGHFDQHGAISSSIITINNTKYLYYIGWTKGHEPPLFYANIGLAISEDGGNKFRKVSRAPIIPFDDKNPILMTSPHVIFRNNKFYMFYVSGVKWERIDGNLQSRYRICSAESNNGLNWFNTGRVIIDLEGDETNFARPWVISHKGKYYMWFSKASRTSKYKLDYATSINLSDWCRQRNKINLKNSENNFDSEMMCYPSISIIDKYAYLFYNGNNFGFEGIGLAISILN